MIAPPTLSHSPEDTKQNAALLLRHTENLQSVRLIGEMGAGKTEWVRGLVEAAGIESTVSSPTFTLQNIYENTGNSIHHWDLYRLDESTDWASLGFEESLRLDCITVVEWPEKWKGPWPKNTVTVSIEIVDESSRSIQWAF